MMHQRAVFPFNIQTQTYPLLREITSFDVRNKTEIKTFSVLGLVTSPVMDNVYRQIEEQHEKNS